jgi:hypothetical protein
MLCKGFAYCHPEVLHSYGGLIDVLEVRCSEYAASTDAIAQPARRSNPAKRFLSAPQVEPLAGVPSMHMPSPR